MVRGLIAAVLALVTLGTGLACSVASLGPPAPPPPPSNAAAPWVGCFACNTTLTATHILDVDAAMPTITLRSGLQISASADTLTALVAGFEGDSGFVECELQATVANSSRATLIPGPVGGGDCPVYSQWGFLGTIYPSGVLTLDGGALTAELATAFQEVPSDTVLDAGLGTLSAQCTRLSMPTCAWLR